LLEYDEELGICKTHIQEKGKDKIYSHDDTDRCDVSYPEEAQ
jgi:hypothetical protein